MFAMPDHPLRPGEHAYKLAGSSLKSMIGHAQGACGAAGIAASLLAMRDGVVPPTINVEVPDPNCDLDYVPDIGRKVHRTPARKKTAGARRKAPAGLVRGNSDLSTGPSRKKWLHSQLLTSYDVVRHGKVASRGKFQERRQRDGAPAAVEESAPPALSLIHPWRGGWRWRYWR
jgi:hypothetical protein